MPVGSGTTMGWGALLGFASETTWGTRIAANNFMEFISEDFQKKIEEEKLPSLGSGRSFIRRVQKGVSVEGSLSYYLHPVDGIMLLKHALMGTVTSAQLGVTGSYAHTLTASDMSTITQKGLSFEVRPGAETTTAFSFEGCRVESMKISAQVGEPVSMEMSFIGRDSSTVTFATTTATYSGVRPFMFQDGTFQIDGSLASMTTTSLENIISFELELKNNLQSDNSARSLGSTMLTALPPGRREVSLKITQRFDTTTAWSRFINGTRAAIRLKLDTGQTIGSVAAATTYSMFIDIPAVFYNNAQPKIGDSGILTHDVDITSIGDTTTSSPSDLFITVYNSTTTYA